MKRTERKEREFDVKREEILAAAEKVFAANGFHGAAMSEIASAAGFAVGSLYRFFPGKEELYTAMVSEKLAGFYTALEESVRRSRTLHDKVEVLIRETFRFVDRNAKFCMMLMRREGLALPEGNRILQDRMVTEYQRQVSFIAGIFEEAIRAGVVKPCETRSVASALKGIIHGFVFDWMVTQGRPLERQVGAALDLFSRGIGTAPPTGDKDKIRGNP